MWQDEKALREAIENVLQLVRENLAMHGGDIEIVEIHPEKAEVSVKLTGTCVDCPLAQTTFESGVEELLLSLIPNLRKVIQVTGDYDPHTIEP